MNSSFREARLPQSWKEADIIPIPKQKPVKDVNKHLRPISLTPILSKVAEDYVVWRFLSRPRAIWNRARLKYHLRPYQHVTFVEQFH